MVIWSQFRDALFELDALYRYKELSEFLEIDWRLKKRELFSNAYTQCRKFFGKNEAEGIYGETPLQTIESILRRIGIKKSDTFIDLGCGRGRLCFFTHALFGCRVKGVDLVPAFIWEAQKYTSKEREFIADNYINHVKEPAIYYWYGLTTSSETTHRVIDAFAVGSLVITISEPIEGWKILDAMPALFPWGETIAYVQRKSYEQSSTETV